MKNYKLRSCYSLASLVFISSMIAMSSGCVSTYKSTSPEQVPMDDYFIQIPDRHLEITIEDDVLTGRGGRPYAKMARRNKIQLFVLSIRNSSQSDLSPTDLIFLNNYGDTLQPLNIEETLKALIKPITDEEEVVTVDLSDTPFLDFVFGANEVANEIKRGVSHIHLSMDISEHYIDHTIISAGGYTKCYVALPISGKEILEVRIR